MVTLRSVFCGRRQPLENEDSFVSDYLLDDKKRKQHTRNKSTCIQVSNARDLIFDLHFEGFTRGGLLLFFFSS